MKTIEQAAYRLRTRRSRDKFADIAKVILGAIIMASWMGMVAAWVVILGAR